MGVRKVPGRYAAPSATTSTGTASLNLGSDPLGSQFLNDSAEPPDCARPVRTVERDGSHRFESAITRENGSQSPDPHSFR